MTMREAVIQAWIELGISRETAESRAKTSDGFIPDAAAVAQSPLRCVRRCQDAGLDSLEFAGSGHGYFFFRSGRTLRTTSASCFAVGSLPLNSAGSFGWS